MFNILKQSATNGGMLSGRWRMVGGGGDINSYLWVQQARMALAKMGILSLYLWVQPIRCTTKD